MFRFTIRDVLWLTVVAALIVGWWLDHRQEIRNRERVERERDQLVAQSAQLKAMVDAYQYRLEQLIKSNVRGGATDP